MITTPVQLLALGFGSGLVPKAPGTVGTVAAIPFFFLLLLLPIWAYVTVLFITFALGIYLCQSTADDLGVHDHPAIVWDEFVGLWVTLLPVIFLGFTWYWLVSGFILFRFFDIIKPWPIRWFDQQISGGLGIMLDDVVAGIVAALCLWLLIIFSGS
ncbi:phosphatidylglycerophosphatase [Candidatus Endobugula sertula]|uniref:Phosphatidylglycerophosphatase A n=1 Tax=Candidatus Endobugula sertula TaxID=62101 RepID=A0A1D2QS17_9GAMM|nr:phosphatidylglycerophosphatase [Candidatus Endobugula sertula]